MQEPTATASARNRVRNRPHSALGIATNGSRVALSRHRLQSFLFSVRCTQLTSHQESRDHEEEMAEEWRTMAVILDRLLFWGTVVTLVVFAIWITIASLHSPHFHPDDVMVSLEDYQYS